MEKYLVWIKILCFPACIGAYYSGYYIIWYFPRVGNVIANILVVVGFLLTIVIAIHHLWPNSCLLPRLLREGRRDEHVYHSRP